MKNLSRFFFILVIFSLVAIPINSIAQSKNEYTNPILAGFYPDPGICKVGDDFYLVNSTFSYFPGLPVFHSNDLINWKLISYVMNRPEQLNLDKQGVSRGLFAPAIRYDNGIFYVTCTLVDIGGNFVVTAKSAEGPWSNPIWLPEINGIDPSLFFDEDRKSYIIYNSIAPDDKPLYNGHRTIRMYEFDRNELRVKGKEIILVNGGTDLSKKPVWIEGPHIFKKDGYYYLIAAEGGTADQHSEVVFRSTTVDGPYTSYQKNPILTQRHLNPDRNYPITSTGHADFVEFRKDEWWAVFLGCRPYQPYKEGYYNTGRETFMAPVKWENGWPVILFGNEEVKYKYPTPTGSFKKDTDFPYSGNFTLRDEFDSETLNLNWQFLRTPNTKWYDLTAKKGFLEINLKPETVSGNMNPAFIGRRQQHLKGFASTAINFKPTGENEKAGLLIFQNEKHFYFLCKSLENSLPVIQLYKSTDSEDPGKQLELLASTKLESGDFEKEVYLKIEADGNKYHFLYSVEQHKWLTLIENVDATFLSTRVAGGFVGSFYAMYATSLGKETSNSSFFNWFEYLGDDEVFNVKN